MTKIPVYSSDIYVTGGLPEAVQIVQRRALNMAIAEKGSHESGLNYLKWPSELALQLLEAPIANIESGDPLALIPLIDIPQLTYFQFGKCIMYIAIHAVAHLGSNPEIADFFGLNGECPVRRAKESRLPNIWGPRWLLSRALDLDLASPASD
jgi:hypothetical protein